MMIIQIWQGITLLSNADQYQGLLAEKVSSIYYQNPLGNLGVYLCREEAGKLVNFLVLSLWSSREVLARFTCPATDLGAPSPAERELLVAFESAARNYEVCLISLTKKGS